MPNHRTPLALIAGCCAALVLFIWWHEQRTFSAFKQATSQYGRYLEIPLWNLDTEAATQYLQLIGHTGDYRSIAVYHADGKPFASIKSDYAPDGLDRLLASVRLIRDQPINQTIYRGERPLGRIAAVWINDNIYLHICAALFLALLGKILHFYLQLRANSQTLARNNLELQQSERRLRESEDHLQRITESLGEGLLITDMDDVVLYANTRATTLTGFSREELLGRPAYELLMPPAERHRMLARNKKRYRGIAEQYEVQLLRKDGEPFWALVHGTPFRNDDGAIVGTLGAITDITERKQLEAQLQHAQKVDAIGQLTAGIAHNFNNMLLGIMGNIEFASADGPDHIKPYLDESYRVCERAAEMVAQLMAYSHRGVRAPHQLLDPAALIARTLAICHSTFDRKITIETALGGELPAISGDAGQVEQSLLNLMINARDALDRGDASEPAIRLDANVVTLDAEAAARSPDAREGTFLRLQVRDNGDGMDAATRDRVFDPFFTTKEVGQGTGLGLSTVYGTARQHGGWAECASAPGQGATFALYFPPAPDTPQASADPPAASAAAGAEAILVVDDEETVRDALARCLAERGYATLLASNGREGLDMLRRHRIDLVLLDLSMPLVSGHDMLQALGETGCPAKVIVFTGYAATKDQFEGVADVVHKPIKLAELLRKIRQVLDA